MNLAGQIVGVLLVVGGLLGAGAVIGRNSRDDEIEQLKTKLQAETQRADGAASTLKTLTEKLAAERKRRDRMRQAAETELAALADRVAALSRAAAMFENTIRKKASNDEDCAALRAQPVCAAVADGLWGREATAAPH